MLCERFYRKDPLGFVHFLADEGSFMIVCSAGAGLSLAYLSFSVKLGFFYSDAFLCPYAFVACSRWFCPCFYFFMAVFALVM